MKRFSPSVLFLVIALAIITALPALAQQESVMDVHLDKAAAIPGHVLPPGHYVFRLMNQSSYPGFVQITSRNGSNDYGFIQVFPSRRQNAGNTKFVLSQPDQAGLARVKAWYFPGEKYGYRFDYTKRQIRHADLIAQRMQAKSNAGM